MDNSKYTTYGQQSQFPEVVPESHAGYSTLQAVTPASAGLQVVESNDKEPYRVGYIAPKDGYYGKEAPAAFVPGVSPGVENNSPGFVQRRKRWLIGAVVLVIVIMVVVLAAVFGSRAASKNNSVAAATPSAQSGSGSSSDGGSGSQAPTIRQHSTNGAWNGSAIAEASLFGVDGYNGSIIYQSANGNLNTVKFRVDDSTKQVTNPSYIQLAQKAANGTALSTTYVGLPSGDRWHLTYIDDTGTLADAWLNMTNVGAGWQSGTLAASGFKAPTDGRVSMSSLSSGWYSSKYGSGAIGLRLWVGGSDGVLHQYTYDGAKQEWSNDDHVISGSFAYGATDACSFQFPSSNGSPSTFLFNSLANGTMEAFSSSDGDRSTNATNFPSGSWRAGSAIGGSFPASANASAFCARDVKPSPAIIYPTTDGRIVETAIVLNQPDAQHVLGSTTVSTDKYGIMPGSSFTALAITTKAKVDLIMYYFQKNGSDLSWAVYDRSNNNLAAQGSFNIPS